MNPAEDMREVCRSKDDEASKVATRDNKSKKSWTKGKLVDIDII